MKHLLLALLPLFACAQQRLTLQQCLDSALHHNRTLQNAALAIDAAGLQADEARTKYYPQISANLTAFHAFDKIVKGDGTIPAEIAAISPALAAYAGQPYSIREFNSAYSATLSIMQPVYAGGRITTANRLAAIQRDVSELQLSLQARQLKQKITENFWQIAAIEYNLSTLDAADRQVAEMHRQVEQFLNAGMCNRNDLLRVTLRQQELQSQRLRLDNARHVLLLLLAQQIGLANQEIEIISSPSGETLAATSLPAREEQEVGSAREEVLLASKAVEAAEQQVRLERGKLLPTVSVGILGYNTGLGGLSSTARDIVKTNQLNAMLMTTVSVPISDWWGGSKAVRRRQIELRQHQATLQDVREQISVDIQSAWADLRNASQQVDVARTSVEQAAENLRLSSLQYQAGTETIANLLDAETLNRQALNSLNQAQADYQKCLAIYRLKNK